MMIHAYQEIYLNSAQSALGDTFDYAINTCGINGNDFVKLFLVSSICKRMENGEPDYLTGKSGIEIARDIIKETKNQELRIEPQEHFGRSKEYWIGWAVAYYQWYSGRKYSSIFKVFSFEDLAKMYYTLHEADISKKASIAFYDRCPSLISALSSIPPTLLPQYFWHGRKFFPDIPENQGIPLRLLCYTAGW